MTAHDPARTRLKRAGFFVVLALTALPILLFPLRSAFYHELYRCPRVEGGAIDLMGYDFDRAVPLDGEWEFFWRRWIVTDGEAGAAPDRMARVPLMWSRYELDGERLPPDGYASYRIRLKNLPPDRQLMAYVPNSRCVYRVFWNGELIAGNGILSRGEGDAVALGLECNRLRLSASTEAEMVVEVSANTRGGLLPTPILADNRRDYVFTSLRYAVAAVYIGILAVSILGGAFMLLMRDARFHSVALVALDVLITMRILVKDEFRGILKVFFPLLGYDAVNDLMGLVSLFTPAMFLMCARDLLGLEIDRGGIARVVRFEAVCAVPMVACMAMDMLYTEAVLCLISFAPFVPVLARLYRHIGRGAPYTLLVAAGMMFVVSSLVVSSICATGSLLTNISLYSPTCFVIAILLQDFSFLLHSRNLQREALAAADLRLALRESETALMLSQIKPHFLYNALLAIQVLCTRSPETAQEAVGRFSRYLRANMQSIGSREPIPFRKELEHIENYVAIERLRFGARLRVDYDIGAEDFRVPPLTIQPLVENAIRHGACRKATGGSVTLRTRADGEDRIVQVIDDGPGFDPAAQARREDALGLRNISLRLQELMGASIAIDSAPGAGTAVTVRIPGARVPAGEGAAP